MSEAAFEAGVALVGGAVHRRADRGDNAVMRVSFEAAADAAVAAGCADSGFGYFAHSFPFPEPFCSMRSLISLG